MVSGGEGGDAESEAWCPRCPRQAEDGRGGVDDAVGAVDDSVHVGGLGDEGGGEDGDARGVPRTGWSARLTQ